MNSFVSLSEASSALSVFERSLSEIQTYLPSEFVGGVKVPTQ